ncbi:hypothetical protein EB796_023491 [Bugula neritina]|uniref:Uncharacterized protein n=1 Tax=Bugula neritina TaxID=10212 RepID=A0A7J7IYB7_BUGNE|nr:hypothetical protein EB796_023491 [Bugula neritina]
MTLSTLQKAVETLATFATFHSITTLSIIIHNRSKSIFSLSGACKGDAGRRLYHRNVELTGNSCRKSCGSQQFHTPTHSSA